MTRKQVIAGMLSVLLTASMMMPIMSNTAQAATAKTSSASALFSPAKLQNVKLTSKSFLEVNDVQFYNVQSDKIVYYTVTVHNNDSKSLDMMDYWFNVKSDTGEKYSIKLLGLEEARDNQIPANTTKTFKIYTKVNPKLNYFNLSLNVVKWDFSAPGFERAIGSVKIPTNYLNVTPVGKDRMIQQNTNKLLTTASALQLVEVGDQTEAMLSVFFTNKSDSTLTLNTYKYYLRTADNRFYTLEPEAAEVQILPGEKKKINFYAKLPANLSKNSYQLFIAEETGTDKKMDVPVAYYSLMLRSQANTITAVGKTYPLSLNGQSIETKVTNSMIDSNTEYHNITFSYELKNVSKNPVKTPKYQYFLESANKALYPLETTNMEESLLPGVTKEVTMTTSIPANLSTSGLKLLVKRAADEGKNNDYFIAKYQIPTTTAITSNSKANYVNKQGAYEITVENFERLPWDTQDIVNATITVKNIGKESQPMPKIAATAWFNGVKIDAKNIKMLNVQEDLGLAPGATSKLLLTTKISSQSKFDTAKLQLSESIDDKPVSTIGNFMVEANNAVLPTYLPGSTSYYTLEQPGTVAELNVLESNTYKADANNIVESLLTYRNTGKRFSKLPVLQAYYLTEDGTQIPAKVSVLEGEAGPGSANLITITANVPKKYEAKNLKLLVGQGISQGKYISGNETADSYVNGAILVLAEENTKVNKLFDRIDIRPYTFNINKISANSLGEAQVRVNFEYNLGEYKPFDNIMNKRKLTFEIVYNGKKFSKSYEVGKDIVVGDKIKESFTIDDIAMTGVGTSGFTLNVYDELNGGKKLLISHDVYSFSAE